MATVVLIPEVSDLTKAVERPEQLAPAAKFIFDLSLKSEEGSLKHVNDLISSITPSQAPQTRSQTRNASQRDVPPPTNTLFKPTPLTSLFIESLDEEQIWAQLDIRTKHMCEVLDVVLESELPEEDDVGDEEDELAKAMQEEGFNEGDEDEEDEEMDFEEEDGVMELDDGSDESEGSSSEGEEAPMQVMPRKRRKGKGPTSELDDGFFSLNSFKAEIEKMEAKSSSRGHLAAEDDSEEEDFDNEVDLFAPVDEEKGTQRAAPSPKKSKASEAGSSKGVRFHDEVRVKKIKAAGKGRPLNDDDDDGYGEIITEEDASDSGKMESFETGSQDFEDSEDEGEMHRKAIQRLKDDLLADDDEKDESMNDLTTHERRMAELKDQIAELELENVGQRSWTLMGEADARARPQNSLLEEDLEFERTMKPTPVITEEAVHSLEELIKIRILEKPVRRRYRDGKLKKEHDEIEEQWDNICNKLDALSNAHYVPKQPKSLISSVSNISTATMESALPTTRSAASMLAPEEVFAAESSQPRARTELTPAEKRAQRAKDRKAKRKQRDMLDKTVDKVARSRNPGSVKKQKQAALESIVKHGKGVTVVGKAAKDLKARGKLPKKAS
ncbi:Mpp10 protein [Coprinellus micaceus]|uniref:U3 small nucleolar ribonucleoprotein protein MPP10 n=1 Tax=Coprinellus micaceus TaxID=71717 RepID=A0A4Y7TLD5_COPMI|nr:Mpp10 protein [Coprinellus micaceus]